MLNKKILFIALSCLLLFSSKAEALDLSRVKTWGSEVLTSADLNAEFDNIVNHDIANADIASNAGIPGSKLDLSVPGSIGTTTPGTGAFSTLTISGNSEIGNSASDSILFIANDIQFEGATNDTNELTLVVTDPTADRDLTIPDADSVTLPSGAAFYMITGSCPAGTTDITATYSNKFVRINATGGSTSGDDTHTHAAGTYVGPSHNHGGTTSVPTEANAASGATQGGSAHAHTITAGGTGSVTGTSASGDNVPAYVTAVLCLVD